MAMANTADQGDYGEGCQFTKCMYRVTRKHVREVESVISKPMETDSFQLPWTHAQSSFTTDTLKNMNPKPL